MLDLAAHVVEQKCAKFQPEKFEDRYEALKDLIAKKQKGMKIERPKERAPSNVVNLMEALRASVQSERRREAPRKSARPSPRVAQKRGRSNARQKKAG
jgi:DNA end-binding protein Ku